MTVNQLTVAEEFKKNVRDMLYSTHTVIMHQVDESYQTLDFETLEIQMTDGTKLTMKITKDKKK